MKTLEKNDPGTSGPSLSDGNLEAAKNVTVDKEDHAMVILKTLFDTTWRIFAPVLLLFGIGYWLDTITETAPLYMLIGACCGIAIAAGLVWLQLRKIRREAK